MILGLENNIKGSLGVFLLIYGSFYFTKYESVPKIKMEDII